MEFFDFVFPKVGLVCVVEMEEKRAPKHTWFQENERAKAIKYMMDLDAAGVTVYFGQASFDRDKLSAAKFNNSQIPRNLPKAEYKKRHIRERSQENALFMRSFFLDIDVGDDDKKYATQELAFEDMVRFCKEAGFPMPTMCNSGNGLYAWWHLDQDIDARVWKGVAQVFKKVLAAYGFKADPMRTADSASILRPPGAHNRKTKPTQRKLR